MTEMSTTSLTLAYGGEALRGGTMDVRELAPALLALGDAFRAARAAITAEEGDVHVYIKAGTPRGSFPITIEVAQPILVQAADWLTHNGATIASAKDLLEVVGLSFAGATTVGLGAWGLVRRLRGRKIDVTEKRDDHVVIHVEGDTFQVHTAVFMIASSPEFRRAVTAVMAPLTSPGVDTLEIREDPTQPGIQIADKEDAEALAAAPLALTAPAAVVADHEMMLEVVRVHFRRGHRWQLSDGNRAFGVTIEDKDFLDQVDKGEVRFGKRDRLRVRLRTEQGRGPNGELVTEYYVTKVIERIPAVTPHQPRLPFTES